ncbi:DUF4345 family protein [Sandaracinobacter sp. RS1-74]|uniref:DUF4345 family protein n=1 Tax=Sandaracinobacteroides sayramensis TaxID=2913411 RepID=UPI001EDAFA89|nr:DUF4345 family protein [Sandaracinobacteroides sayramensis]MCG2840458.1 DUF4345 family protein [Sandaracinobacteroides sayramensis]
MKRIFQLLIGLVGLFNVGMGVAFLLRPAEMAAKFFLTPHGSQGLASIRADFSAFFLVGGLFALLGAVRADPAPLRVPALLLSIALLGRTVSLVLDGVAATAFQPMLAEAVMILILVGGMQAFRRG